MTNVQAAILLGQLEVLPEILEKKSNLFGVYRDHLVNKDDAFAQTLESNSSPANWMFGLRLKNSSGYAHAEKYFKDRGVEIRPMFYPLSSHAHLINDPKITLNDETVAKTLNETCFILPSYPDLLSGDIKHILDTLDDYLVEMKDTHGI